MLFQATVNGREQVVMGTIDGEVVAVAKLALEEDVLVLRGVQITEAWRGHGIGKRLLAVVASHLTEPCFVIPYGHLERFYAAAGFHRIESGIPPFLADRCAKYRSKGDDVFVALRSHADGGRRTADGGR
jgi:N-acetylglutamate synthase-like GNAT family acetyltransferase